MTDPSNADTRFLPPGYPLPEREVMAQLKQSILHEVKTPYPPETAELAVLIIADEAGVDLAGVDARAIWLEPPESRSGLFLMLKKVLQENG